MNVLAIAPHPDDESIGCGGTLHKHALAGEQVSVVFLTSGELGLKNLPKEKAWEVRESEARRAAGILRIAETHFLRGPDWMLADAASEMAEKLAARLQQDTWSIIYLPHPAEWHPDHQACLTILRLAMARDANPRPLLRGYEIWTPIQQCDHIEDISSVMRVKLRAIRAHASQIGQLAYDRASLGLNTYRGAVTGNYRYAEAFQKLDAS